MGLRLRLDACFVLSRKRLLTPILLQLLCGYSEKDDDIQQWEQFPFKDIKDKMRCVTNTKRPTVENSRMIRLIGIKEWIIPTRESVRSFSSCSC